jgi:hypothetical protein
MKLKKHFLGAGRLIVLPKGEEMAQYLECGSKRQRVEVMSIGNGSQCGHLSPAFIKHADSL